MPTTKFFPGYLESVMRKNGVSQVELNKLTGIAVSRINNYLKGKYRTVTPEHLESIVLQATANPAERSELIKVYVFDLITDKLRPMVEINPLAPSAQQTDDWFFSLDRLPPEFSNQFRDLYKNCISSPRVRERTAIWMRIMQETLNVKEVKSPLSSHIRKRSGDAAETPAR